MRSPAAVLAALSLAGAALAAAACSKSHSGASAEGAASDPFAATMADAFCSALRGCCAQAGTPNDDDACRAEMTEAFALPAKPLARMDKVSYDPEAALACAAAMKARVGKCALDGGAPGADTGYVDPLVAACHGVFRGTVERGGACKSARQCATGGPREIPDCVAPATGNGDLVCAVTRAHVAPGGDCTVVHIDHVAATCEPALGYCAYAADASAPGTCVRYAAIGERCVGEPSKAPLCDPGAAYCDFLTTRTCVALPNQGEPCPGRVCAGDLGCDGAVLPAACAPRKAIDAPCTAAGECASGLFCNGAGPTLPDGGLRLGKCTDRAVVGRNIPEDVFAIPRACKGPILPPGIRTVPPFGY